MELDQIICGDVLQVLKQIPDDTFHCCVTSPPYWGLRDYGHDGQIGLEATPEAYVARMVEVFREVRRVLRDDGTLWLNLGDSYASGTIGRNDDDTLPRPKGGHRVGSATPGKQGTRKRPESIKPKDLVGIPWRVAFALQADGWWLRQDIIWHKPNPMPESVRDRCTKAHEYVFLLTKSERYFCDSEAIHEKSVDKESINGRRPRKHHALAESDPTEFGATRLGFLNGRSNQAGTTYPTRNRRSVWTVTTKPYSGAHFAVMPADLVEPCIKAGCPEGGAVIDPFSGSGTTAMVARNLSCRFIGIELNPAYVELSQKRLEQGVLF
jgi:DNA modification methylase